MESHSQHTQPHITPQLTLTAKLVQLYHDVLNDKKVKIKEAKYLKYLEQAQQYQQQATGEQQQNITCLFAGIYKNIGRIIHNIPALQWSITIISRIKKYEHVAIRWDLQLAAHKSFKKLNQQCYQIAQKSFHRCKGLLEEKLQDYDQNLEEDHFLRMIEELCSQETKDELIWLMNERSISEEMVAKMKMKYIDVNIPFYAQEEFQIADYMSLEECPLKWEDKELLSYKEIIKYLSISAFTMATEKYYQKEYNQKHNHLKALQISLAAFHHDCNYTKFLLQYLLKHFGKRMAEIKEEKWQNMQMGDLRKQLPRDVKEVSLKYLRLPDQ